MEKESLTGQLQTTKKEMETVEKELQALRETYNSKQDNWIKEKLDIQVPLKLYTKILKLLIIFLLGKTQSLRGQNEERW